MKTNLTHTYSVSSTTPRNYSIFIYSLVLLCIHVSIPILGLDKGLKLYKNILCYTSKSWPVHPIFDFRWFCIRAKIWRITRPRVNIAPYIYIRYICTNVTVPSTLVCVLSWTYTLTIFPWLRLTRYDICVLRSMQ